MQDALKQFGANYHAGLNKA